MMKHAKPRKILKKALFLIFVVAALVLSMIVAILLLFDYASSGYSGYKETPYFSIEPWTMGIERVTEEPEPTYPTYFTYKPKETETNG